MFNIAKWFAGITLVIVPLKVNFIATFSSCRIVGVYADCVGKLGDIESFPKDLKQNIEVLNLSKSSLSVLNAASFADFTTLKELIMDHMSLSEISADMWSSLTELQILNISSSFMGPPWPQLPSSLKRFIVENIRFTVFGELLIDVSKIDFGDLQYLEEVYLKSNELNEFPNIPKDAPLIFVDLRSNPMRKLRYFDIASFCVLEQFKVDGELSRDKTLLVQCCGVQMWLEMHNVTSNLSCADKCPEQQFEPSADEAYEICLERLAYGGTYALDDLILNIIISIAIILAIVYLVWRYYKSHTEHHIKEMEQFHADEEEDVQAEE